jgi:hypothetical protein
MQNEDISMINFQIFPSQYEQNGNGEKCCWLGGRDSSDKSGITLEPYQTDAINGYSNPEWGFHLLSTGQPDEYKLKYVKMSDPSGYWYGVSVDNGKLILLQWKEGVLFIVKKLGEYYTLQYKGEHVECENGNLGKSTTIQVYNITPPTPDQVANYNDIPSGSFRILWKFIKMEYISGRDWIAKLRATGYDKTIDRLFIPGTHDSGTEKNTQWYQTQFHTIPEQAAMGVRYFDLRVAKNWEIYHEKSYSGIYLKYVVDSVVDHLTNCPEEFFIIQITPEEPTGFSANLFSYLQTNCPSVFSHVYTNTDMPKLSDAKGKIIFFARYYTPVNNGATFKEYAIDWADNTQGSRATIIPFPFTNVYVQDHYKRPGDSDKFDNYIKPILYKRMFPGNDTEWIINFTSVSNASYPIHAAERINPWVANLLMWTKPSPTGILMIDDARVGNVANIIALNFD